LASGSGAAAGSTADAQHETLDAACAQQIPAATNASAVTAAAPNAQRMARC